MTLPDELEKLERLREDGALSEDEFQRAKARLINEGAPGAPDEIHGVKTRTWCMLLHLSQLLAFAGGIGIIAPIIMWVVSKDQSRDANRHGIVVMNWMISSLIYSIVSGILAVVLIGIPLLITLLVLLVVFPIIGALKANEGILWRYPLSIKFMDPDAV
jgi:uncharacterized Tic20 family protein